MQGPRTTFIYLAVVFGLLVIPRALQRFRLPAPLTCFAFGIIVAGFFKPLDQFRPIVHQPSPFASKAVD